MIPMSELVLALWEHRPYGAADAPMPGMRVISSKHSVCIQEGLLYFFPGESSVPAYKGKLEIIWIAGL